MSGCNGCACTTAMPCNATCNVRVNRHGLARFVQDIAAPLITRVGSAWSNREIGVFEEHLFSQNLEKLFHSALANLSQPQGCPRVLLTTLAGEEHTLGLLMVEALLALEEACPIQLGAQTPVSEIARAARLERIDVVCLSFSSAYLPALAQQGLRDLRQQLPAEVELWAGGHGVKAIRRPIEGVCFDPGVRRPPCRSAPLASAPGQHGR
jgi:methylmalonyl-CoA mutase cobalamin-binding subunit